MKYAFMLVSALAATACNSPPDNAFPGYAEGEYVRLASPLAGTLVGLHLRTGDRPAAGAPAYALEQASETAARQEAQSRLERAEALLSDLRKGARSDELAAIAADLKAAQASLALSSASLDRDRKLFSQQFIARARLDEAVAAAAADRARVDQARARLRTAHAGARTDQIAAAEREADAARAQLAQAQWRVDQKVVNVPVAGLVSEVNFRLGEWVPAGVPVLALLPASNVKARFFIPEAQLGKLRVGQAASIACDGCPARVPARITFISPQAEYTSPLIYSKENRSTLVFMVEATPDPRQAAGLHPGQPLTVTPGAR